MKKILCILLLSFLFLTACNAGGDDTVVVGLPQDPDYLDPHRAVGAGTREMLFNIFEGLMKQNPDGSLSEALAESYTISEDKTTYTFTLRQGVLFHNGEPVTPEDVVYSYERLSGQFDGTVYAEGLEGVLVTSAGNDVTFTLPEPNGAFLSEMIGPVIPKNLTPDEMNDHPIGTGPYMFSSYTPADSLKLEAFKDYWNDEKKAKIPYAEFRIFSDNNAMMTSLLGDEIDVLPRVTINQLPSLDNFDLYEGEQNLIQFMGFNLEYPLFSNPNARKAIAHAIDKDDLIKVVAQGKGTILGSNLSPVMGEYFREGLEYLYPYDIERAKELLAEVPEDKSFTITVPSNYDFHVTTAEYIATKLNEVGFNVDIETVEWGVWLDRVYAGRQFEATIIAFDGVLDPDPLMRRYTSDFPRNMNNYSNPVYDELLNQAISETDVSTRAELYGKAQEILAVDLPSLFIMDPTFMVAVNPRIGGYTIYSTYVQDLASLYVKEQE